MNTELEKAREIVVNSASNSRYLWLSTKPSTGYVVCDSGYGRFVPHEMDSSYFYYWLSEMLDYAERNGYSGVFHVTDNNAGVIFICPFNTYDSLSAAENVAKERDEWAVYDLSNRENIPTRWF